MSMPPFLHNKVREALIECGPFGSNEELRAIFADPRIAQWRNSLPEGSSRSLRVNFLIQFLLDAWNTNGENALVLFLIAASERYEPIAPCRKRLRDLARELEPALIQDRTESCKRDLKQLDEHEQRGWADPAYASRKRRELRAEIERWEAKLAQISQPVPQLEDVRVAATSSPQTDIEPADPYTTLEISLLTSSDPQAYFVSATLGDGSNFTGAIQQASLDLDLSEPEQAGQALFGALFSGEIREAYVKARALSELQTDNRLRFHLRIDKNVAELHAVPWEILYYPVENTWFPLAADAKYPLSRYVPLSSAEPAPLDVDQLRILMVIANPANLEDYGLASLNIASEIDGMLDTLDAVELAESPHVTLMLGNGDLSGDLRADWELAGYEILPGPASLHNISQVLELGKGYHLLHFLGHGAFSARRQRAALYLEDELGNVQLGSGMEIAQKLASLEHPPSLVFLAACEGARRDAGNPNPFVGLAARLVQVGTPAVVAMQDAISIGTARKFTQSFYAHLFEHGIVDKAVNQARNAIYDTDQWSIPVLYTRLKDGRLFAQEAIGKGREA